MFIRAAGRTVGERVVHGVLVDEHEIVVRAGPLQGLHGLDVPVVSFGADVGGVSPVPAWMWARCWADVAGEKRPGVAYRLRSAAGMLFQFLRWRVREHWSAQ